MSEQNQAMKDMKFDKRLIDWNLANGLITKEELEKYLQSLPDLGSKVELFNLGDEKPRTEAH